MPVDVRRATLADADDIARLTVALGYDADPAAIVDRLSRLLSRADQHFFVADDDGRVVGWLHALRAEYIEAEPFVVIGGLVVDARHRKQGIGRSLMQHAEAWAVAIGCPVVRLSSTVTRTAAHEFYERLGYTRIKTQYAFAKSLDGRSGSLRRFVPRVDD